MTISCQKDEVPPRLTSYVGCEDFVKVRLYNMSGLADCKWLFYLEDTLNLETLNLESYKIPLKVGEKYWITYEVVTRARSSCTGREMISITDIKDQLSISEYEIWAGGYQLLELKYMNGPDGCGFVFLKILKGPLLPINFKDFEIEYANRKKYLLAYEYEYGYGSACTGNIIKILCLKPAE